MSDFGAPVAAPWRASVVQDFAGSELFDRTFQEGMELVEETAAYLDGAGRHDSKALSRSGALAYAASSMRLTTRLMQMASWLLVQRAVREGDMAPADACQDRYRITYPQGPAEPHEGAGELPAQLVALTERADRIYERVVHLDQRMYLEPGQDEQVHPILTQMERIQAAFSGAA
jgi:regulator of CtrA degradation